MRRLGSSSAFFLVALTRRISCCCSSSRWLIARRIAHGVSATRAKQLCGASPVRFSPKHSTAARHESDQYALSAYIIAASPSYGMQARQCQHRRRSSCRYNKRKLSTNMKSAANFNAIAPAPAWRHRGAIISHELRAHTLRGAVPFFMAFCHFSPRISIAIVSVINVPKISRKSYRMYVLVADGNMCLFGCSSSAP